MLLEGYYVLDLDRFRVKMFFLLFIGWVILCKIFNLSYGFFICNLDFFFWDFRIRIKIFRVCISFLSGGDIMLRNKKCLLFVYYRYEKIRKLVC